MNVFSRFHRASRAFASLGAGTLAWLSATTGVHGQSIVYSNYSSTSGLSINGSATTTTTGDGTVLRLVASGSSSAAGSAFVTTQRTVTSGFSTAFQFRLSNRGGITDANGDAGADGFVFVLQRTGATAVGGSGISMGYAGIGSSSAGIEFDTYNNGAGVNDPSSNHVGVDVGGSITSLAVANIGTDIDSVSGGSIWTAWIDYDGTSVDVRLSNNGIRPGSSLLSYNLNLSSALGGSSAWVGFTAGTGGAYANHDIIDWTFSDTYVAGGVMPGSPVPEPTTWAAIAGGLMLGVAAWRRRQRLA